MNTRNARIKDVTLNITFETENQQYKEDFHLSEDWYVEKMKKLLKYANANDVFELVGKLVRVVTVQEDKYMEAFGDPIKDEFVYRVGKFFDISQSQIEKLLNNSYDEDMNICG